MRVLLIGEPMGLFMAGEPGPLSKARSFTSSIAGAEYNVAVGLARLGHTPVYCTRLGDDPIGRRILLGMAENNIDTSLVQTIPGELTGLMLKGSTAVGDPEIAYYRRGSAASGMGPGDVDRLELSGIDWLHVTGIFPAVSESAMAATLRLLERAGELGIPVSFDPNLRPQLWPDQETMVRSINRLAGYARVVLPGIAEGKTLTGCGIERDIAMFYHAMGADTVIIKLGGDGACYAHACGDRGHAPGIAVERIVDTVGAGDGFAVGVISALLEGLPVQDAAIRGNAIGAIQISHKSDNEGLPTREELMAVLAAGKVEAV